MDFTWPEFQRKEPLPDGRAWTATFESYDQYRETCYYRVVVFDGEHVAELVAEVGTEFAGDDWTAPAFTRELRARLAGAAAGHRR